MTDRAIIVGAGQAGLQGATSLRMAGFAGEILMFGKEPAAPYQRPPLSKAYLKGELDADRLALRPSAFFESQKIVLYTNMLVTSIDRASRTLEAGGERYGYDRLLIATGAPPRRLDCEGADAANVYYLRTQTDSDRLRAGLAEAEGPVLIVGAGYIGLEVAAVARRQGRAVTVLEAQERPLSRVAPPPLSSYFEALHRRHGVEFRFGARLAGFATAKGRAVAAVLEDGSEIPCAVALVGIGAAPAVGLAEAAGLTVDDGVWVDEGARTGDPAIWAAGDCTNFPSVIYGRRMRLESVPNAIEQAKVAGANMAGGSKIYAALPWFWSDQYDAKLQTAGCAGPAGCATSEYAWVVRGDPARDAFSVWTLRDGAPDAVDAVNDPAAFAIGRLLVSARTPVDPKALADPEQDLKSLLSN